MRHPDYIPGANRPVLEDWDDECWDIETYIKCLEDWDVLNECFECCERDLADDYGNMKHHLRWRGLEVLREVDNR